MQLLVTGSEGSLAQMVIPKFQELGHSIVGCDNLSRQGIQYREGNYPLEVVDLTDSSAVKMLSGKYNFDAIFHAAALVYGVIGFHKKPADILVENNLMTMNLLKHCKDKIKKFIYLSSSMVYESCMKTPLKEEYADESTIMSTAYGLSKYVGERMVKSFYEQYGAVYTIWRPFNIITPFESHGETGFSHVFSDLFEKILIEKQHPVEILGDGEQVRCFTNIRDVVDAVSKFSLDRRSDCETFNVGNKEPVTIKQLAKYIVEIGKKKGLIDKSYNLEFKHLPIYEDDVRMRIPDVSKMKEVFGWEAKTKLYESLEEYIDYNIKRGK